METIYIRLQKLPGGKNHAPSVEGRSAAKNWEKLNAIAGELNTKPLGGFLPARGLGNTKEEWFAPAEALVTISKLISRIASNARTFDKARHLIQDLNSYANILVSAEARGSKFRFSTEPE